MADASIYLQAMISGSGSTYCHYPVSGGYVYNLFDTASDYWYDEVTPTVNNANYATGSFSSGRFPTYSIANAGIYQLNTSFDIASIVPIGSEVSYWVKFLKDGNVLYQREYHHAGESGRYSYIQVRSTSDSFPFNDGEKIEFRFQIVTSASTAFTASVSSGSIWTSAVVSDDILFTIYSSSAQPFISGSESGSVLVLSDEFSTVIGGIFDPLYTSGSIIQTSSLYTRYGDVVYPLSFAEGDIILLKALNSSQILTRYEFTVIDVQATEGKYRLTLNTPLPSFLDIPTYNLNTFDDVLFLKKVEDETQVLLSFDKREGRTSYGLIIPKNLHPDVLKNMDSITKELKLKLIEINASST